MLIPSVNNASREACENCFYIYVVESKNKLKNTFSKQPSLIFKTRKDLIKSAVHRIVRMSKGSLDSSGPA